MLRRAAHAAQQYSHSGMLGALSALHDGGSPAGTSAQSQRSFHLLSTRSTEQASPALAYPGKDHMHIPRGEYVTMAAAPAQAGRCLGELL